MIKTIKVKNQLRLDELVKYVFDNDIKDEDYYTSETEHSSQSKARIGVAGNMTLSGYTNKNTTFIVEVEEEITDETVFEDITVVFKINSRDETGHFYNSTLKDIKRAKNLLSAYTPIDGKLKLIWESSSDE